MRAHIRRPVVRLAAHRITTEQLLDHLRAAYRHPDDPTRPHPRMGLWERLVANTGVEQRYWSRPLQEATAATGVAHRAETAFNDALALAEEVAREALDAAGLQPGEIDAIVTSHTTSWAVPNLDVHLVHRLGLRPTVARIPLATLACAGGAHALVRATHHVTARPGDRVLVVAAETLSTIYHHGETSPQSMIYRSLFGDSAAACIVTGTGNLPAEPGFLTLDTFELVMPNSLDRYWGTIDHEGLHFDSTKAAASAAADTLPYLTDWVLEQKAMPLWAAVHPGGPRIINDVVYGLGLDPEKDGRHAYASLADNGNLGGVAVLDVLARTHGDPPVSGDPGVLAAFGPGFTAAGVYGAWYAA